MKRFTILGIALLLPLLAGAAEKQVVKAVVDADGVQRVEMTGGGYFFEPNHIIVKAGVPVELKVRRDSLVVPHRFMIQEKGAGVEVAESLSREPTTIRFTFSKPGRYQFYCDNKLLFFKSHREQGMEGVIEVLE